MGHQDALVNIVHPWRNSWMLMAMSCINQPSKVSIYYYHAPFSWADLQRPACGKLLWFFQWVHMCQLKEQGSFCLDSLLMDCINLKFVRWLQFNSSASYWLEISLINQPIDLKSPFLIPLLKYPTISIYLAMLISNFFACVVIPFDDIWKITGF